MKEKTITYFNEVDNSIDILVMYKLLRNPEYKVIYVCKNKDEMISKQQQFEELIAEFNKLFNVAVISKKLKGCISFLNLSDISFISVTAGDCSVRGRSANMLVFQDEEYFKDKHAKDFENLRYCIIPVVSSNKDGILIS